MKAGPRPAPNTPIVLRTAAIWGTTVLLHRELKAGTSFTLGDRRRDVITKPLAREIADCPILATRTGWVLDPRGATGGVLFLGGVEQNGATVAREGQSIPIKPGDYGLIQYENFGIFFQFSRAAPLLSGRRRWDWTFLLSFVFSVVAVLGGLALMWGITAPPSIDKPVELISRTELALKLNLKPEKLKAQDRSFSFFESTEPEKKPDAEAPKEEPSEPEVAKISPRPRPPDDTPETIAEVLSTDMGDEVRRTLGAISSVAQALGGLDSKDVEFGRGGAVLRGSSKDPAVTFGSGTLDTGWGTLHGKQARSSPEVDHSKAQDPNPKESPKSGQGLGTDQVNRVVMSRFGAFRACYETGLMRTPGLKGVVAVSFSILPTGSVGSTTIASSTLNDPRVESCILRQFQRLTFQAADKRTNASYPFSFSPSKRK